MLAFLASISAYGSLRHKPERGFLFHPATPAVQGRPDAMEMFRFGDFAGWLIEVRKRTIGGTAATPHKKRGYIVRCNPLRFLERETGFEPATFSLGS